MAGDWLVRFFAQGGRRYLAGRNWLLLVVRIGLLEGLVKIVRSFAQGECWRGLEGRK